MKGSRTRTTCACGARKKGRADGPLLTLSLLARRGLVTAVVASSVVGLVVDSVVFLWLAFGSLEFLLGQVVGKAWMVLLSIPFVAWLRRRDERLGIASA